MANLPEESKYDEGVYQIERKDRVVGGPDGVSNKSARNLANRTKWLKDQIARLFSEKADKASPTFTGQVQVPTPADNDDSTSAASTSWVRRVMLPKTHAGSRGAAVHGEATTTEAGFMSPADKVKLNGIATGAQANAVTSVAGRTGAVTLAAADVSGAAPEFRPRITEAVFVSTKASGGQSSPPAIKTESWVDMRSSPVFVSSPATMVTLRGHPGMYRGANAEDQVANIGYVKSYVSTDAVASINGKRGTINKLDVADVEGAAPLNAPHFKGTVEFANHVNFRGGVAFHDNSYGVQEETQQGPHLVREAPPQAPVQAAAQVQPAGQQLWPETPVADSAARAATAPPRYDWITGHHQQQAPASQQHAQATPPSMVQPRYN